MFDPKVHRGDIESSKLILDKVFRNTHKRQMANDSKYFYYKALSKIKHKYKNNPDLSQELFLTH